LHTSALHLNNWAALAEVCYSSHNTNKYKNWRRDISTGKNICWQM